MKFVILCSAMLAVSSACIAHAANESCPIPYPAVENFQEQVMNLIDASRGCENAAEIAESCGTFGTAFDVPMASAATKKCETEFLGTISSEAKTQYKETLEDCDREYYRSEQGSQNRSFNAFCRLAAAKLMAAAAPKSK